ncbi:hypothetical protein FOZ61_003913, partial [Perkinsus olseni]
MDVSQLSGFLVPEAAAEMVRLPEVLPIVDAEVVDQSGISAVPVDLEQLNESLMTEPLPEEEYPIPRRLRPLPGQAVVPPRFDWDVLDSLERRGLDEPAWGPPIKGNAKVLLRDVGLKPCQRGIRGDMSWTRDLGIAADSEAALAWQKFWNHWPEPCRKEGIEPYCFIKHDMVAGCMCSPTAPIGGRWLLLTNFLPGPRAETILDWLHSANLPVLFVNYNCSGGALGGRRPRSMR